MGLDSLYSVMEDLSRNGYQGNFPAMRAGLSDYNPENICHAFVIEPDTQAFPDSARDSAPGPLAMRSASVFKFIFSSSRCLMLREHLAVPEA